MLCATPPLAAAGPCSVAGTVHGPQHPGDASRARAIRTRLRRTTYRGSGRRAVDENVVGEGDPLGWLTPRQRTAAFIRASGLQHSFGWNTATHITQNGAPTGTTTWRHETPPAGVSAPTPVDTGASPVLSARELHLPTPSLLSRRALSVTRAADIV